MMDENIVVGEEVQLYNVSVAKQGEHHLNLKENSDEALGNEAGVSRHLKSNSGERPMIKCDLWTKSYVTKDGLRKHNRIIHAGEKNHQCDFCSKSFLQRSDLLAHLRVHISDKDKRKNKKHDIVGKNNHKEGQKIELCGVSLKEKSCKGLSTTHAQGRPKKCYFCGKLFAVEHNLLTHLKLHIREKLHNCKLCSESFYDKSDLTRHLSLHTGQKSYECSLCSRLFTKSTNFDSHIKNCTSSQKLRMSTCEIEPNDIIMVEEHCKDTEVHDLGLEEDSVEPLFTIQEQQHRPCKDNEDSTKFQTLQMSSYIANEHNYCQSERGSMFKENEMTCVTVEGNLSTEQKLEESVIIDDNTCRAGEEIETHEVNLEEKQHKSHNCDLCSRSYSSKSSLARHLKLHTCEKPYKCKLCSISYNKEKQLAIHLIRRHNMESLMKPWKCNLCSKSFNHFRNHIKSCTELQTLQTFPYDRYKRYEEAEEIDECGGKKGQEQKSYKCSICSRSLSGVSALIEHLRLHVVDLPYECYLCSEVFSDSSNLNSHVTLHNAENTYKKCILCNKTFSICIDLINHVRVHIGENLYKCVFCNKSFNSERAFIKHLRFHIFLNLYKCILCKRSFPTRLSLYKHINRCGQLQTVQNNYQNKRRIIHKKAVMHEDLAKQNYKVKRKIQVRRVVAEDKCKTNATVDVCGGNLGGIYKGQQESKENVVMVESNFKPIQEVSFKKMEGQMRKKYKCNFCYRSFSTLSALKEHLRLHVIRRPHKCYLCNEVFSDTSNLKSHVSLHIGENTYKKCILCSETFSDCTDLINHVREHIGEKSNKCVVCKKSFNPEYALIKHLRLHLLPTSTSHKCILCKKSFEKPSALRNHRNQCTRVQTLPYNEQNNYQVKKHIVHKETEVYDDLTEENYKHKIEVNDIKDELEIEECHLLEEDYKTEQTEMCGGELIPW